MTDTTIDLMKRLAEHLTALEYGLYEVFKLDESLGGGWKVVSAYDKTPSPAELAKGTLDECLAYVAEQMA